MYNSIAPHVDKADDGQHSEKGPTAQKFPRINEDAVIQAIFPFMKGARAEEGGGCFYIC